MQTHLPTYLSRRAIVGEVVLLIGVAMILSGIFLQQAPSSNEIFMSFSIGVSMDGRSQSADGNNRSAQFSVPPNTQGEFTFSILNDGKQNLTHITSILEDLTTGLTLNMLNRTNGAPLALPMRDLSSQDSIMQTWSMSTPKAKGNYEANFIATSDKAALWFNVTVSVD